MIDGVTLNDLLQQGIAIAVLIWIVHEGLKQSRQQQEDHNRRTEQIIQYLLKDNQRLADTLITCISAISAPPPPPRPPQK